MTARRTHPIVSNTVIAGPRSPKKGPVISLHRIVWALAALGLITSAGNAATLSPWTLQTNMNVARAGHASPTVGPFVFAIGGQDRTGAVLGSVEYARVAPDGTLGSWALTAPLNTPRYLVRAVGAGGMLYVVGGWSATGCCSGTVHYRSTEIAAVAPDGTITAWLPGPDLVQGMGNGGLTTDGAHLYYVGGFGDADKSWTVQVADILTDGSLSPWRLTTPLPVYRRENAATTVFASRVYAFGGYEPGYLDSVVSAPILAGGDLGPWRFEVSMSVARIGGVAFSASTRVFVGAGGAGAAPLPIHSSFEEAVIGTDGILNPFMPSQSLNVPRADVGGGAVGKVFIVTGGWDGTLSGIRADTETTICLDLADRDEDGIPDVADNCPDSANTDQADSDGDRIGDVCDPFPDDRDNEQAQCEADLGQCQADLATCGVQCQADLAECRADLTEVQHVLTQCAADLAAATADTDQDGRRDLDDRCAGTVLGDPVDDAGCSPMQFCSQFDATCEPGRSACRQADWRNDEPLMTLRQADCRIDNNGTPLKLFDDRCVPVPTS